MSDASKRVADRLLPDRCARALQDLDVAVSELALDLAAGVVARAAVDAHDVRLAAARAGDARLVDAPIEVLCGLIQLLALLVRQRCQMGAEHDHRQADEQQEQIHE